MGRDTSFEQRTREEVARIKAEEAADALRAKAAEATSLPNASNVSRRTPPPDTPA
jgi:hypothetical protein